MLYLNEYPDLNSGGNNQHGMEGTLDAFLIFIMIKSTYKHFDHLSILFAFAVLLQDAF
jgi:hypothetical protein